MTLAEFAERYSKEIEEKFKSKPGECFNCEYYFYEHETEHWHQDWCCYKDKKFNAGEHDPITRGFKCPITNEPCEL